MAKPIKAAQAPVVPSHETKSITLPREFAVESLLDGRLQVVEPIKALWREEDEGIVVEAAELNEFGFGDNLSEAMADLQAAIAELYFTLEREQHGLGSDLAAVWATLARKLRRADAGLNA